MYRIEITANTLAELAGKVLALATQLHETAPEAPRYVGLSVGEVEPEVAEAAPADPTPEADTSTSKAAETTEQPSPQPTETTPPASASDAPVDKDTLRTLVLAVVAAKGREAVEGILSQFGLAKASDVPAEQAAELVEALKGAL